MPTESIKPEDLPVGTVIRLLNDPGFTYKKTETPDGVSWVFDQPGLPVGHADKYTNRQLNVNALTLPYEVVEVPHLTHYLGDFNRMRMFEAFLNFLSRDQFLELMASLEDTVKMFDTPATRIRDTCVNCDRLVIYSSVQGGWVHSPDNKAKCFPNQSITAAVKTK